MDLLDRDGAGQSSEGEENRSSDTPTSTENSDERATTDTAANVETADRTQHADPNRSEPDTEFASITEPIEVPADRTPDEPRDQRQSTPRLESDGGTLQKGGESRTGQTATVDPDKSELEVVLEEDPDQLYDTSGSAQRVIDENFNVVKQNRVMTEWTGLDADQQDNVKCMNQMSGQVCGTEDCTVKQLIEQGKQRVEVEIEKELANGETKQTLLVSERITNDRGEVVGITESFKDISNVKAAAREVSNSIGELRETADDVAESSDDISSTAESMAGSMDEVTSEVANVSASIEEVASSAEEVASTSEQAQHRAQDGYDTAEDAIDEMEDIDEATTEVTDDLEDLQDRVDEIDEIVTVINDIADQTNLLALNANIEAARAGEEGEGFAVVANEVKNLAEQAQENAERIESMIAGIKADTDETAESLAQANRQVDNGIDRVEGTMEAIEEIVDAIEQASNGIEEVAQATDDQAASAEEVASIVDQVAEQAEEVSGEIQNIYAANEEQAQMVQNLEEAVERLEDGE